MASFKVPCPSCEAKVLIKNPDLVGTKVECPKCKYRFKVEAPAAGEAPADPAPAAVAGKKEKAGGKKGSKKLLAAAAGVGALVLLVVVGYSLFGGDGKSNTPAPNNANRSANNAKRADPAPAPAETPKEEGGADPAAEPKAAVPPAAPLVKSDKDPTNLLPPDAVAVYRFEVDQLRRTPGGGPLFDPAVGKLFADSTGLKPEQVERYFHCVVGAADRHPVGFLRLKDAELVREADLFAKLVGAAKTPTPVRGRNLYGVADNPFFSAVGHALAARSLFAGVYEAPLPPPRPRPFGACLLDSQTLVLGDFEAIEAYLGKLTDTGYPEFQSVFQKAEAPASPADEPEAKDAKEPKEGDPAPKPKAPPTQNINANPHYLSVAPPLKRMLNVLEADPPPDGPVMVVMAEKWDDAQYPRKRVRKEYAAVARAIDPVLEKTRFIGVSLTVFNYQQLGGVVRLVTRSEEEARALAVDKIGPALLDAAPVLSLLTGGPVEVRNFADTTGAAADPSAKRLGAFNPNANVPPPAGSTGIGGGTRSGVGLGTPGATGGTPGYGNPGYGQGMYNPGGMSAMRPPGGSYNPGSMMRPPPGGGGGSYNPGGTGYGPGGYNTPGGGGGGGSSYGGNMGGMMRPPGDDDDLGGSGGAMGGYGSMMMMGQMGPGGMMRPPGPGGEGQPVGGEPPPKKELDNPHVSLKQNDDVITLGFELNWPPEAFGPLVAPRVFGLINQVKGKTAVFAGADTRHTLGKAVAAYAAREKRFPRGTAITGDARRLMLPYPPAQRLSLFAELLPDLGRPPAGVVRTAPWFTDKNLEAAEAWVPELLVPYYPQTSWRATSPLAPAHAFGGTNYVAVAGLGAEAARLDPKNPAHKDKVGITGYDWGSKVDEVTDGPANTIFLLQVPPGYSRPWAAGGGATVVGVDPADPMAGFKHARPDGKEGTYAIMGDGAVRWLPADIDPAVFRALVTRAGGEKLPADLNAIAPKVEAVGERNAKAEPVDAKPAAPETAPVPRPKGVPFKTPEELEAERKAKEEAGEGEKKEGEEPKKE